MPLYKPMKYDASRHFGAPKGNRFAAQENMSPTAHGRRIRGLFKTWSVKDRKSRGEKITRARVKQMMKIRRRRRVLENVAKEAREIQHLARTLAVTAFERLTKIIENEESNDASAIAAAQVILDRAYGKATHTSINAHIDANGKPSEITAKELDTRIEAALKRVESITQREAKAPDSEEQSPDLRKRNINPGSSTIN